MQERTRWGIAGLLGAGTALAVGELLAGLGGSVPSPLAAIGRAVVDASPPWLKDFAIATFGTGDKTALAVGTSVIAVLIGWWAGGLARRHRWLVPAVFVGFGVLGLAASLGEPDAAAVPVTAATLAAVCAGLLVFFGFTRFGLEVDPTDGRVADRSRRRFLGLAGATGLAVVTTGLVGRRLLTSAPPPATIAIPDPVIRATTPGTQHDFGLAGLTPIEVPNQDFYRIDTALVVPRVDPGSWSLRVSGLVDDPLRLSYDDLLAMDLVESHVTIACVSNEVGGDLVGNARWTGVRLTEVLERAGVRAEADQIVGRSVDRFTAGFPTELAFDGRESLIAVAMNGDPLPASHGFPARLIVPGLYGYVSATKWLEEVELTTWDGFDGYWIPRGWSKEGPIKTQSRIDLPRPGAVPAGPVEVAGVAWAPLRGIDRVEVSIDGDDWIAADLTVPLSSQAWVQWHTTVVLPVGDHRIAVRAMDGTGATQPEERTPARPDGATGHHIIRVSAG